VQRLTKNDGATTYYLAHGPIRAPLALPSGPPVYVFDQAGKLIDYTKDSGDDPRFAKAWKSGPESGERLEEISVVDLDRVLIEGE
jgi:hypothetical protein